MIEPAKNSLYDFVDDNHTAPAIEKKVPLVREAGWQAANNERFKHHRLGAGLQQRSRLHAGPAYVPSFASCTGACRFI